MADLDRMDTHRLGADEYQGIPGRTRVSTIHYSCMSCGFLFTAHVHVALNLRTDPALGDQLVRGELNALTCPSCSAVAHPSVPFVYHDPARRRFWLIVPDALRHQELELRIALLKELAADEAHVPEYARAVQVVFGTAGLRRALDADEQASARRAERDREEAGRRESDERRREELDRREEAITAREEDLAAREEDQVTAQAALADERRALERERADLERERETLGALALDLQARERALRQRKVAVPPPPPPPPVPPLPAPPGPPQDEVDRWRAGEGRVEHLLCEDRVCLLARPGAALLGAFEGLEPTLLLQQRSLPAGPLVCLGALPTEPGPAGGAAPAAITPGAERALFWFFDPGRAEDRSALKRLGEEFRVRLDLYDDEARRVKTWELQAPLEENARRALDRCRTDGARPDEPGSFDEVCRQFEALGEERLGRKQHNFSAESFQEMVSPAAARLAVGIVGYWSQPENEDYLLGVKSFPFTTWRAVRERVVRRGLEWGLRLPPELAELALELKLCASRELLLKTLLSNFAEVSLRLRPSDLDAAQDWENWKHLLADCVQARVQVDKQIEELAAASARRAGAHEDEAAPGGDLGLLPDDALLRLLGQRDQRRDAALELCERRAVEAIGPLFAAACAMTRAEVSRVFPALTGFGQPLVPFLVEGLGHRKSFIRQGSALALGALKARSAAGPLVEMLLAEPSTVWKEAARALGDLSPHSLGALVEAAQDAEPAGRERLAWAMAQVALSANGAGEIQAIVEGDEERAARVASRALGILEEVREADLEIRGQRPLREQTIVRSFSRQFFERAASLADELGEGDIVEQEEVLDDHDIVDEEVEVGDEDILDR